MMGGTGLTAMRSASEYHAFMHEQETMVERAMNVLREAQHLGLTLRVSGSVACWLHCPGCRRFRARIGKKLKDVDLVGRLEDKCRIEQLLRDLDFSEDGRIATIPGARRSLFHDQRGCCAYDVFYDTLEFCHRIDLRGRLNLDELTISLVDLLLQKLQIVELTDRDACDVQMLLHDHKIGPEASETIDGDRLAALCGADWGLWRTVVSNLDAVRSTTRADLGLTDDERQAIVGRIDELSVAIDRAPKKLPWKLRNLVGDRVRWYAPVEGLSRV